MLWPSGRVQAVWAGSTTLLTQSFGLLPVQSSGGTSDVSQTRDFFEMLFAF